MARQGATHDDAQFENIEAGDAITVDYVSTYTDGDDTTTLSGVVDRVDAVDGVIDVYVVPNDDADRRDHYADDSDATRRVSINTFGDGPATTTVEGRNGGRWNRLSEVATDADVTVNGDDADDESDHMDIETGDRVKVAYVSVYTDDDTTTTFTGTVDHIEAAIGGSRLCIVPDDAPDRDDYYAAGGDVTRRVEVVPVDDTDDLLCVEGRNGGRWNRLSEGWGCVSVTAVDTDDGTDADDATAMVHDDESATTTATVFHRKFTADDGDRHEVGADLGMGIDFFRDTRDATVGDVFPSAYIFAGTVDIDVTAGVDAPEAAAYGAWQDGRGHDAGSTRSMATGDIIVVDGDAHFVDRIGFEPVDIDPGTHDDFGDDGDDDTAADVRRQP